MKNLAPDITRQRLLIEGYFSIEVTRETIKRFFQEITQQLHLKMYSEPIIFSPGGTGKDVNQGFDAFVPLIDSGISLYIWTNSKFFSIVLYTCKSFDKEKAVKITKEFFQSHAIEHLAF